jgi:Collagen triple helix repeat (20 copies)
VQDAQKPRKLYDFNEKEFNMSSKQDVSNCNGACPGPMGPMGPQGLQGPQGVAGAQGQQGQPGQNGSQGPIGPQGSQGVDGAIGSVGAAGANGQNGLNGQQGSQGLQGIQGAQGQQGQPGQPGQNGADGPMGPVGPQGAQGLQGVPGNCVECPCSCSTEFAEVFSVLAQTLSASPGSLLAGQAVTLENTIFSTSNIDVSKAASLGQITINLAGWYDVSTGICGFLNPIASPLPCWTLSLFKNGIYVPGSTFANQTISPEQKSNEIVADVFVHFNVGDVLTLANTSSSIVNMAAPLLGTNAPASSAYMKIVLLKADV